MDPELVEKLLSLIRGGVPAEVAAEAVGLARSTFYDWMQQGQASVHKDGSVFREFRREVVKARNACHAVLAAKVYEAGKVDGKLGLAILSKRFARHWADRDSLEVRGKDGGVVVEIRKLPAEDDRDAVQEPLADEAHGGGGA
jgi:hypothetical protein